MKTKQFLFLMGVLLVLFFCTVGCDKKCDCDTLYYTGEVINATINGSCPKLIRIIDGPKNDSIVGHLISLELKDSEAKTRPEIGATVKFKILKLNNIEEDFAFADCIKARYFAEIELVNE